MTAVVFRLVNTVSYKKEWWAGLAEIAALWAKIREL